MTDVHTAAIRSKNMRAIRSKNTKPELYIRSLLHRKGFRFRINDIRLPSKPDVYLPKYKAVILIHGCFWHGHECHLFKWPSSNVEWWKDKITKNRIRDKKNVSELSSKGIRVLIVWQCAIEGKNKLSEEIIENLLNQWLINIDSNSEITPKGMTPLS